MIDLRIKMLRPGIPVPAYQTEGAAALDLCAAFDTDHGIFSDGLFYLVPSGIAVEIPGGHEGQIRARSSWAKHLAYWHVGTIDADYRGEIFCGFRLAHERVIERGERIGQLLISPVARCTVQVVEELASTVRGAGGFGSTGR